MLLNLTRIDLGRWLELWYLPRHKQSHTVDWVSVEELIAERMALTSLSNPSANDVPGGDSGTPLTIKLNFFSEWFWGSGFSDEGKFRLKLLQSWPESLNLSVDRFFSRDKVVLWLSNFKPQDRYLTRKILNKSYKIRYFFRLARNSTAWAVEVILRGPSSFKCSLRQASTLSMEP